MALKKLTHKHIAVWMPFDSAEALERAAEAEGMSVSDFVNKVLTPMLGEGDGRYVLVRIPERTYDQHMQFFENDTALVLTSMSGSIEVTGADFDKATKSVHRQEGQT